MSAKLHFAEDSLPLHLLLKGLQGLIDIVIASASALWTKNGPSGKGGTNFARSLQRAVPLRLTQFSDLSRLGLRTQDSPCKYSFAITMSIRP